MRHGISALVIFAGLVTLSAQTTPLSEARRLYDSGKYNDTVSTVESATAAAEDTTPRLLFLKALSFQKLENADGARRTYQQLAGIENPVWSAIGRSGLAVMDKRLDDAKAEANKAVEQGEMLPEAHYQRGVVLAFRREYEEAARAFDTATMLDNSFAAAHYYGGLSEYRAKRIDRMANHFEAFLKLAPNAPERAEVESIMRTVRGR